MHRVVVCCCCCSLPLVIVDFVLVVTLVSDLFLTPSIISTTNFPDLPSTKSKRQRHPSHVCCLSNLWDTWALEDIFNHGKEQQGKRYCELDNLAAKKMCCSYYLLAFFPAVLFILFCILYSDLIGLTTKTKESSLDFLLQSESITFTVKLLPVTFVQKAPRILIPCLSQLSFESGESMGVPISDRCGGGIQCWQYITDRESCTRFAAWMALVI